MTIGGGESSHVEGLVARVVMTAGSVAAVTVAPSSDEAPATSPRLLVIESNTKLSRMPAGTVTTMSRRTLAALTVMTTLSADTPAMVPAIDCSMFVSVSALKSSCHECDSSPVN